MMMLTVGFIVGWNFHQLKRRLCPHSLFVVTDALGRKFKPSSDLQSGRNHDRAATDASSGFSMEKLLTAKCFGLFNGTVIFIRHYRHG
ncbi:hypothetical protein ACNKHW_06605 [Shigella flexneri]